ncbi:MarR family winged helix-turn-helix transcriptional regulator [Streptomyces cinnabarinus]|uniref:MarR family winged helix-turn-helix transcriptional regulator n=1 Tax=Streptomyces cinnabarinus TaxID=67287 RepID=A0ABY7KD82_9ACTN|nr:MarR family winged helix-turn-helix transcriptional regulator [Streptomyces cinnabarinus]WAZ20696.1 MarR family winged helix-turn-helix transcriptional regulator [Streptomyces cinnabarinus]
MQNSEALSLSFALLATAGELVRRINDGVAARGHEGKSAYGFAFTRIAAGGATVSDVAAHLGVTKQAASQLVDELVRKGYVERRPHPRDARARLLVLTELGWASTRAAEEAAAEVVREWGAVLGEAEVRELGRQLLRIAPKGPIRPSW